MIIARVVPGGLQGCCRRPGGIHLGCSGSSRSSVLNGIWISLYTYSLNPFNQDLTCCLQIATCWKDDNKCNRNVVNVCQTTLFRKLCSVVCCQRSTTAMPLTRILLYNVIFVFIITNKISHLCNICNVS